MAIFAIVLSSLALLAATAALVLTACERKRSLKRNTALAEQNTEFKKRLLAERDATQKEFVGTRMELKMHTAKEIKIVDDKLSAALARIEDLEKGVVPDYEKAKEAAEAVNDFHAGISGILGFDPHEVLRKQRHDNFGGEDG